MVKIYPSLLAADFNNLENEISEIEDIVDGLHMDIMDGSFVPNISFGFPILNSVRKISNLNFDTHLMIKNSDSYIDEFSKTSRQLTVHYEAVTHLHRTVSRIKELGCEAGVSLNPHTPVFLLEEILPYLDRVLIMSVNPGFTGQKFIESSYKKIKKLHEMKLKLNPTLDIMVDGGVGENNIAKLYNCGVTSFVVGAGVFHQEDKRAAVLNLRKRAENND